jgi:hypothetical protein
MGNFGHDDSRVGLEIQFRSRGIYPFVGKRLTPKMSPGLPCCKIFGCL